MRVGGITSSLYTQPIGDLALGKRAVFYDEMSEYAPAYVVPKSQLSLTSDNEVKRHLNNLSVLSMYFDIIFIHTASLFNITDPFIKLVVQRTISAPQFRDMLKLGVVRVVGWGGRSAKNMHAAALDFASLGVNHHKDADYLAAVSRLFQPDFVVYRSEARPDSGAEEAFLQRVSKTEFIRSPHELGKVKRAVERSVQRMEQLVSVPFYQSLRADHLASGAWPLLATVFLAAWNESMAEAVPGVKSYFPQFDAYAMQQLVATDGRLVNAFLYSPQIFVAFLRTYFTEREYNSILAQPFDRLYALRNGDWKRFCDAYHKAIAEVSMALTHTSVGEASIYSDSSMTAWAERLKQATAATTAEFDVDAFIQGLSSIAGIFFGLPLLFPAFKFAGAVFGKRVNREVHAIRRERKSELSPYIRKIRMSMDLQTSLA